MEAHELKAVLDQVKQDFAQQIAESEALGLQKYVQIQTQVDDLQAQLAQYKTATNERLNILSVSIESIEKQNIEFVHVKDLVAALEKYQPTVIVDVKAPGIVIPEPAKIELEPLRELLEQFKPHLVVQTVENNVPNNQELTQVLEQLRYAEHAIETRDAKIAELENAVQVVKLQAQELMSQIPVPSDPVAAEQETPQALKAVEQPKDGE